MKTAVIIHGYNDHSEYTDVNRPAASNDHWLPWLQRQLLLKGIEAQTPEMPGFYEPNYERWKSMLERFNPDESTILVGHSCGGGFLVRWLSEESVRVGKVVLVAPWLDPEKAIDPEFFEFTMDPDLISKTAGVHVMYSTDDFPEVLTSVQRLKTTLKNVSFEEYSGKGHFTLKDMGTEKFPELLQLLV